MRENRSETAVGAAGEGRVGASGGMSVLARAKAGGIENQALWDRLRAFELDRPGDERPFSARLAHEQGWTREFALRAIDEYRKFVYLMATAPFAVTPSKVVDEVWHLHLMHTRSYWHGLCGDVVGRELHHDPSRGGAAERAKFEHWYERTLTRYRESFGPPPMDIWPGAGTHQPRTHAATTGDDRNHHRGVDHRGGWVVIGLLIGGAALLLYAMTSGGCMLKHGERMTAPTESNVLIGGVIVATIMLATFALLGAVLKRSKRRSDNAGLNRDPGHRSRHSSTTDHLHHNPSGVEYLMMQNMLNSSSGSGGDDRHHDHHHHHGGHDHHHDGGGSHDGGSGGGDSGGGDGGGGGGDGGGGGSDGGGGSSCGGGGCGGGGD